MEKDLKNQQIKQRIVYQLELHNMSIRQLSIKMGSAYSTTHEIVTSHKKIISIRSIERIAAALDIDVDVLLVSQDDLSGSPGKQKKI